MSINRLRLGITLLLVMASLSIAPAAFAKGNSSAGTVVPLSASGCNGYVCITVNGSGLTVNYVATTVQNPYSHTYTSTGSVYRLHNGTNSKIANYGSHALPPYPTKQNYTWNNPLPGKTGHVTFYDGDKVCVQWTGITGYPCEYIYK